MALEVTEATATQGAFEVITTVTTSLFAKVLVINMALLVPAFMLFTFH